MPISTTQLRFLILLICIFSSVLPAALFAQEVVWVRTLPNRGVNYRLKLDLQDRPVCSASFNETVTIGNDTYDWDKDSSQFLNLITRYSSGGKLLNYFPYQGNLWQGPDDDFFTAGSFTSDFIIAGTSVKGSGLRIGRFDDKPQMRWSRSLGQVFYPDEHLHLSDFGTILTMPSSKIYPRGKDIYLYINDSRSDSFKIGGKVYRKKKKFLTHYIMKFDSSGNYKWTTEILNTNSWSVGTIWFEPDGAGNIYGCTIAERAVDSFIVNKVNYPSKGISGTRVVFKLNSNGQFVWTRSFSHGIGDRQAVIAVPSHGGIYLAASYFGDGKVGNFLLPLTSNTDNIFITYFDSAGNVKWVSFFRGLSSWQTVCDLIIDNNGKLFLSGTFSGKLVGNRDTISGSNVELGNIFIARLDSAGIVEQLFSPGGSIGLSSNIWINEMAISKRGELYCAGFIKGEGKLGRFQIPDDNQATHPLLFKIISFPLRLPDSITVKTQCFNDTARFSLYYQDTPDSVLWDFGDGSYSADLHPEHEYAKSGIFTVNCTAWVGDSVWSRQLILHMAVLPERFFTSPDTTFCKVGSVDVSYLGKDAVFQWNDGNTQSKRSFQQEGVYKLVVSLYGCTATDSIKVHFANIKVDLGPDRRICSDDSLVLTAPAGTAQRLWSNGSTDTFIIVREAGKYWLQLSQGGCLAQDEIQVDFDQPIMYPPIPADTSFCGMKFWNVDLSSLSIGKLSWQDGSTSPKYSITAPGQYRLTIENACGQYSFTTTVRDSDCVCNVYIPNSFTPDANGLNPHFIPVSNCSWSLYRLAIYNRWGQRIWESTQSGQGWDGTCEGAAVPEGVYLYMLQYRHTSGAPGMERGIVHVIRR